MLTDELTALSNYIEDVVAQKHILTAEGLYALRQRLEAARDDVASLMAQQVAPTSKIGRVFDRLRDIESELYGYADAGATEAQVRRLAGRLAAVRKDAEAALS